jgi:hypothetical protein
MSLPLARQKPKGAPTVNDAPPAILPALGMFKRCRGGLDVRIMCDALPPHLLPPLAGHVVTRPALYSSATVQELVRVVGFGKLAKQIGTQKARGAVQRLFPQA